MSKTITLETRGGGETIIDIEDVKDWEVGPLNGGGCYLEYTTPDDTHMIAPVLIGNPNDIRRRIQAAIDGKGEDMKHDMPNLEEKQQLEEEAVGEVARKPGWEMVGEIEDALEEGIELRVLVAPKSISERNGKLVFELDECELREFDASGRRRPVPVEGCVLAEEYDTIFAAIGQAPDLSFTQSIESNRNTIKTDRLTLQTNLPGVFAGGDAVTGPARVVDALAAGRRAAKEIDRYLAGIRGEAPEEEPREEITITMEVPEEVIKQPMAEMPKLPPDERIKGFAEVELGLDEETARRECSRCLRCDVKLD